MFLLNFKFKVSFIETTAARADSEMIRLIHI